jgi:nitrous oxide reductase accessory protein NosL
MKHSTIILYSTITILFSLIAMTAFADTDLAQHRDCAHCGMDRKAYGYSRMLVEYKNGTQIGTCSIHCVVTELNNKSGEVASIKVADRTTRALIDAEKAVWVIGGSKRGVMTQNPKWAFATQEAARTFVDAYGGKISKWEATLQAAREDSVSFGKKR